MSPVCCDPSNTQPTRTGHGASLKAVHGKCLQCCQNNPEQLCLALTGYLQVTFKRLDFNKFTDCCCSRGRGKRIC